MRFGVLCLMNKHRQIKGTKGDRFYLNTLTARNHRKTFINNRNFQYRSSEILFIYNDKQLPVYEVGRLPQIATLAL